MTPELIVEVGFTAPLTGTALHLNDQARGLLDHNTLGADDLFTDVSGWVTRFQTRRGATRTDSPLLRYEQGTATIVLRNDDRRFDPTNLAGPYVVAGRSQVEPMRAVRIRARINGVTYPLWRGFADKWKVGYDGPGSSVVTLTCVDGFAAFASYDRNESVSAGAGEDSGARINRILDSIAWPDGDRMVAVGDSVLQATTLAANTLTELHLTADSEMGELFMDADGRVRFRNRLALAESLRSARPLARLSDAADESGAATTVNLVTNPSSESGITGWLAGGFANFPVLTHSSTRAMFGSFSVLATWATATPADIPLINYTVDGLTAGRTYTFSVYAYVPSGSPSVVCVLAATGPWGADTGGVTDQWVRLTLTTTVAASSVNFQVWPALSTTTAGQQVWLDGLQVEESPTVTDYVDGDQPGAEWDGVAHASTSRRLPALPYADVELDNATEAVFNLISIARTGGTAQVVEDATSRTAYLTRTFSRTDLLLTTDAECLQYASSLLGQASRPQVRFASMRLRPAGDDRLWPQALGREIGDRLGATRTPPGGGTPIEREVWLRGISHQTGDGLADWTTEWVFQSAAESSWLVLDNPTSGVLDDNILAY
ncbi:carbohydrate binding domain-containing protein [Micromonospora sp. DT47]|uniref:carbohydrate binding domain-containing protein n=1 Tax=Micromonospora sp. DT47 TaxID=3393431 RepID=UPI003CF1DF05